jgi:hypothetical protein
MQDRWLFSTPSMSRNTTFIVSPCIGIREIASWWMFERSAALP